MKLPNTRTIYYYLGVIVVLLLTSYVGTRFRHVFASNNDEEYDLIRKYLLTDNSPLVSDDKPKIWIHTKFEYNARNWQSFQSRSSMDLNQPYIHITMKSVIDHCAEDFQVCLIDDNTFAKLLPAWDVDLMSLAEPMKTHVREIGLAELVYQYGGMIVPNSFVCLKNMQEFYRAGLSEERPFVCEKVNRVVNLSKPSRRLTFMPDSYFLGAPKNSPVLKEYIEYLKERNWSPHFSSDREFGGDSQQWFLKKIDAQEMNLMGGEMVGVKTNGKKPILVDDLLQEDYLDISPNCVGIYIPEDEILERTKYQWFAVMKTEDILKSGMIISKYMQASILDSARDYYGKEKRSGKGIFTKGNAYAQSSSI